MPITLPVEGRADDRSFDRVADRAEKRFAKAGKESGQAFAKGLDEAASKADPKSADRWTKAYDKVADAAGKVRVEEAKLADLRERGAAGTRLIAQSEALERARRAETRATREAASAYMDLSARTSGFFGNIGQLASGTRFGGLIADTQTLATTFGGMGLAAGAAITGVAGLAVGIGVAANKLYDLGKMWDDVADGITGRTGKVGEELNGILDQVSSVAIGTAAPIAEIGDIAGRVAGSLRLTGDELGTMTAYISDLNQLTGEQTNIRQLAMLFNVFNVEGKDQIDVLNGLYQSYIETQVPVNELIDTLVTAGPKVDEFGLSLGDTAALLASFVEAGVKPEAAVKGLTLALNNFAKAGKDPADGLQQVIEKIREFERTGNDVAAQQLAVDVFGKKNAAEFLQVIEDGRVNLDNFSVDQQGITRDIRETKEATNDWQEELQILTNYFETGFKPIADATFNGLNDKFREIAESIILRIGDMKVALNDLNSEGLFGPNSAIGKIIAILRGDSGTAGGGGGSWGDPAPSGGPRKFAASGIVKGAGTPYGLPRGTNTGGYGNPQARTMFPDWVSQLGDQFGVEPSTYPGHQEGSGLNQGIDWVGSVDEMQAFAEFLTSNNIPGLEQVIWQNPNTKKPLGLTPDGQVVTNTNGYYSNDWAGHQNHVHTRFSQNLDLSKIGAGGMRRFGPRGPVPADMGDGGITPANPMMPTPPALGPSVGPGYQPGPAGATLGYNQMGDPGYYVTDPRQIRNAQERVADVNEAIADATEQEKEAQQRLTDAKFERAEVEADILATDEDKKRANEAERNAQRAYDDAKDRTRRLRERDLRDANEALTEAQQGNFRSAQKAPGMSSPGGGFGGLGQVGAPLASDFGASGGLGGIAQNLTTFLANLGFAPMIGALTGVKAGMDPTGSAGSGLFGIMGALGGFGGGGQQFGVPAASNPIAAGGNLFGGALGAAPGPAQTASTVGGITPAGGRGEGGLGIGGGLAGMAMSALQAAAGAGGMGANMMAPGAGAAISAAADIGIKLANRGAQFAGQAAGIGVGGIMEALLPVESSMADPMNSWFGRIIGGMMGAAPNLPNMAGQAANAPQSGQGGQQQAGADGRPPITVNYTNNQATEDRAGADLTNHLMAMNTGPGM